MWERSSDISTLYETRCADQRKSQQDLPPSSQPLLPHNIPRLPRPYRAESESLPPSHQIREKLRRSIPPLFTGPISSRPTFHPEISIQLFLHTWPMMGEVLLYHHSISKLALPVWKSTLDKGLVAKIIKNIFPIFGHRQYFRRSSCKRCPSDLS